MKMQSNQLGWQIGISRHMLLCLALNDVLGLRAGISVEIFCQASSLTNPKEKYNT